MRLNPAIGRFMPLSVVLVLATVSGCFAPFGDPSKHIRRRGGFGGFAGTAGAEAHHCNRRCNPAYSDAALSLFWGWHLTRNGAVTVEGTWIHTDSSATRYGLHELAATFGYQYWVHPRLWARAGVGPFGFVRRTEESLNSPRGAGAAISWSIGTNWVEFDRLAVDVRALAVGAASAAGAHGFAGLGVGVVAY